MPAPTAAVLDTNVMLDWLVFDDPHGLLVGDAVIAGRLQWLMTDAMRDEAIDVLGRLLTHPPLQRWQARHASALAAMSRWSAAVDTPSPRLPPGGAERSLQCTDRDDQCFIDLAIAHRVPWLLTRDRALLRLARAARPFGVTVLTPQHWCEATAPRRTVEAQGAN
ncbi:MAG: putative toxin-antitoxin system toxin component, PIN family [Leptothrix sp. (in: b-proteobacteria)]